MFPMKKSVFIFCVLLLAKDIAAKTSTIFRFPEFKNCTIKTYLFANETSYTDLFSHMIHQNEPNMLLITVDIQTCSTKHY